MAVNLAEAVADGLSANGWMERRRIRRCLPALEASLLDDETVAYVAPGVHGVLGGGQTDGVREGTVAIRDRRLLFVSVGAFGQRAVDVGFRDVISVRSERARMVAGVLTVETAADANQIKVITGAKQRSDEIARYV